MRIKSLVRNSFFSFLSQLVLLLFGFLSQRAMNLYMGTELVGMNGVISNVIAILSVTELGISTAIVYHLYGALANHNEQKIAVLMNLYRRAYYVIAGILTVLGLAFTPFVHLFMTNKSYSISYIRILYLLWLLRTVLSYPLSYKKSLLIADQNEYVVSITTMLANIIGYSAIILFVTITKKYLPALVTAIIGDTVLNIWISRYVDRKYPFLSKLRSKKPDRLLMTQISDDLKNVFVSRVSFNLLNGTDNLIISGFVSVAAVGIFNNYGLITRSVGNILSAFASSIQPGIGNLFVEEDYEKDYDALRQMTFLFFLLVSVAACGLYSLIDFFIADIWLKPSFCMSRICVFWAVLSCILQGIGLPISVVMGVSGMFDKERILSLATAIANLALSLVLVFPFGIAGVLFGTCFSYLLEIVYRMVVFFHEYVKMSGKRYVVELIEYMGLIMIEVVLTKWIVGVFYRPSLIRFLISVGICVFVPMLLNFIIFGKSDRFKRIKQLFKSVKK